MPQIREISSGPGVFFFSRTVPFLEIAAKILTRFLFDAIIYVGISLRHIGLFPRLGEYCCGKGRETEKVMGVSLEEQETTERCQMAAKPEMMQ